MGPWQENGLTVSASVARNARLRSNRTIKVPFATLSTTMQVLHQRIQGLMDELKLPELIGEISFDLPTGHDDAAQARAATPTADPV